MHLPQIDGIPCLKANNYTLEEGEQSVFSRELNSAPLPFCSLSALHCRGTGSTLPDQAALHSL